MRSVLFAVVLLVLPILGWAAEPAAATAADSFAAAAPEGLSPGATDVFKIGAFPVTNSMLVTWIVALGTILFARRATRKMKEVPEGAQNFWEWMVESLYNFLEDVLGLIL